MGRWRYQFVDLVTDRDLVELDLDGVQFDRRICQPGSFRATVDVPNPAAAERVAPILPAHGDLSRGPGRTAVHVWRGSEIWGTYILWQVTPSSDDRGRISVSLRGASLESYLAHREIRRDLIYTQVDQNDIAADLVADMEAYGPIGLEMGAYAPSGRVRDRVYLASEAATYAKRLEQLSEVIDGPEWMIRTWSDAHGLRRRVFEVGRSLGQDQTDHVFTQPGNVVSWSYPADATDVATSWQARGDTPNQDLSADSQPLMSGIWSDPRYAAAGWPLLERTEDYQSVIELDTLNAYARWWAERRSGMLRIPQVTVRLSENATLTPNRLGDRARLTLVNLLYPLVGGRPSFSASWRVVGMEVSPATRGSGQDTATLIFEEPTDGPESAPLPGLVREAVA